MRIMSIANSKGGAGKSTTTLATANALSAQGFKIAILDADGQATLTEKRENDLRVMPDANYTVLVEGIELNDLPDRLAELEDEGIDIVFIDLPRMTGKDGLLEALLVIDSILIPFNPAEFDLYSTEKFITIVNKLGKVRKENDYDFYFYGFHNLKDNTSENAYVEGFAQSLSVPFFDSKLSRRAAYKRINSADNPLEDRDIKSEFGAFIEEFKTKFELAENL